MSTEEESWATNYPKITVSGNLPQNVNSLETFDDNELL